MKARICFCLSFLNNKVSSSNPFNLLRDAVRSLITMTVSRIYGSSSHYSSRDLRLTVSQYIKGYSNSCIIRLMTKAPEKQQLVERHINSTRKLCLKTDLSN